MVRFYCGLSHVSWNGIPPQPGKYVCVSPIYGAKKPSINSVRVPPDSLVMQDSGAFSDGPAYRLSFEQALERQQAHAERFNYSSQIEYRASYDVLIDEVWDEYGVRHKKRWSVQDAENAVDTTIDAARFLNYNRNGIDLVLSAQGVDASQYLKCTQAIVPYINPERDVFGLGGLVYHW